MKKKQDGSFFNDFTNYKTGVKTESEDPILVDGVYDIHLENIEVAHITHKQGNVIMECVFNLGDEVGYIDSKLPDGNYINLFNDELIIVKDGKLSLSKDPIIIKS